MDRRYYLLLVALAAPALSQAEIFCVGQSSDLVTALDMAATNGESDEIRLEPGTYSVPRGGFAISVFDNRDLNISGGWYSLLANSCRIQLVGSAFETILDGNNGSRFMQITPGNQSNLVISLLHIRSGFSMDRGAGLVIQTVTTYEGNVTITRNVFSANVSNNFGGALVGGAGDPGTFVLSNNVLVNNRACTHAAASLTHNGPGGAYVVNNTVAFNTVDGTCEGGIDGCGSAPQTACWQTISSGETRTETTNSFAPTAAAI